MKKYMLTAIAKDPGVKSEEAVEETATDAGDSGSEGADAEGSGELVD